MLPFLNIRMPVVRRVPVARVRAAQPAPRGQWSQPSRRTILPSGWTPP